MIDIAKKLYNLITEDNIAFLSVIITVLIFIFTRHAEIVYKKHDDKKVQYLKLISLLEMMFTGVKKDKNGNVILDDKTKKIFFDTGASLLLYGSKKIYRLYILFREFTSNPLIKQCTYYDNNLILYIMSEILITMRKEVGLSSLNGISNNESLAFFVNDISSNPIAKKNSIESKFRIRMIKLELAIIDRTQFIYLRKIYYATLKPILAGIRIILKHVIVIPISRLLMKLFPKFANNNQNNNDEECSL